MSKSYLFLKLSNLLRSKHNLLLHERLLLLKFSKLPLKMIVLILLQGYLISELLKVSDNHGIDDLDVLVVERLQVVVHHGNVLPQTLYLLLVLSKNLVGRLQLVLSGAITLLS